MLFSLSLNFDWLTNLLAILFVIACLYDRRYDEYGTLTLATATLCLVVMTFELFFSPAFEMTL